MPEILVSICICSYNSEKYIAKTLDSALCQTYRNIELVIVDDGSTDKTREILEQYKGLDNRINIYFEEHSGLPKSRNKSFKYAKGEWLAIIDSDDICYPNRIREQLTLALKNEKACLIFGNTDYIDEEGKIIGEHLVKYNIPQDIRKVQAANLLLQKGCFVDSEAFFAKRQVIEKAGLFDEELKYSCDYEFFIRLGLITDFYYSKEKIGAWRIHNSQMTNYIKGIEKEYELLIIYRKYFFCMNVSFKTKIILLLKSLKKLFIIFSLRLKYV